MIERFNVTLLPTRRPCRLLKPDEPGSALLGLIAATSNRGCCAKAEKHSTNPISDRITVGLRNGQKGWRKLRDPAAAEYDVVPVENRALARGDGALGLVEDDFDATARRGGQSGGGAGVLVADLDLCADGSRRFSAGDPVDLGSGEAAAKEIVVVADHDPLRLRVRCNHVKRLGSRDAKAFALADGVPVDTVVLPDSSTVRSDDLAAGLGGFDSGLLQICVHEGGIVAVGDETDLLA